jgi:hypothetical protein
LVWLSTTFASQRPRFFRLNSPKSCSPDPCLLINAWSGKACWYHQLASPDEVLHGGKRPSSIARHDLPLNLFGAPLSVPPRHSESGT